MAEMAVGKAVEDHCDNEEFLLVIRLDTRIETHQNVRWVFFAPLWRKRAQSLD